MERRELARLLGAQAPRGNPNRSTTPIVIEERDPKRFTARFASAVATENPVFLADPAWGTTERERLAELTALTATDHDGLGWLMIPSGGTSGQLKFARHDSATLAAAVHGFCEHFAVTRVNVVNVLPLHHVSGVMAWLRCALTGGEHIAWDWKVLEAGQRPTRTGKGAWFLSLVPTQLQRLLASPDSIAWLRGFTAVFIGGGPAWPELLDAAAAAQIPIALSYGMTETAAMVTALRPAEFAAGVRSSGRAMPHAQLDLHDGVIAIRGDSVFRGYWPERRATQEFITEDLGQLEADGQWHVLGRRDAVIITGGKKVDPAHVETVLRASGEFDDIAVIALSDAEWGQIVVACHPASSRAPNGAHASESLAPYQRPKHFVPITPWPRNAQGKLNRAALAEAARSALRHPRA